jgi:hypothetical protein
MKKLMTQISLASTLVSPTLAQAPYNVQTGDVLSKLVQARYPNDRIYGARGKLKEILKLNPHIQNPNTIYPNQTIYFIPELKSVTQTETQPETQNESRFVSEEKGLEEWNVSALYGAKYLSITQSGALGKAELGVLFLNHLSVQSEFVFDQWSIGFQASSYQFRYKTLTAGDTEQMYDLSFFGSYKWFIGGINIEESPLFRNNSGAIEMTKMSVMSLSIGARKDIELPTRMPTMIKLKALIHYPLSSSSSNADIKLNSINGFRLMGQTEFNRQILARNSYSLHATWMTQMSFHELSQDVEWDTSSGETNSTILDASTSIGLLFKF